MSRKASLTLRFEGDRIKDDHWRVPIKDGVQFVRVLVNNNPVTVEGMEKYSKGGSLIPLQANEELTIRLRMDYPGDGAVQIVPMVQSGRQPMVAEQPKDKKARPREDRRLTPKRRFELV